MPPTSLKKSMVPAQQEAEKDLSPTRFVKPNPTPNRPKVRTYFLLPPNFSTEVLIVSFVLTVFAVVFVVLVVAVDDAVA